MRGARNHHTKIGGVVGSAVSVPTDNHAWFRFQVAPVDNILINSGSSGINGSAPLQFISHNTGAICTEGAVFNSGVGSNPDGLSYLGLNQANLSIASSFTLAHWGRWLSGNATEINGAIGSSVASCVDNCYVVVYVRASDKKAVVLWRNNSGTTTAIVGAATIESGDNYHLGLTYDAVNSIGRLYVNGSLDASGSLDLSAIPAGASFRCGNITRGGMDINSPFYIGDIRTIPRIVSDQEMNAIYLDKKVP